MLLALKVDEFTFIIESFKFQIKDCKTGPNFNLFSSMPLLISIISYCAAAAALQMGAQQQKKYWAKKDNFILFV